MPELGYTPPMQKTVKAGLGVLLFLVALALLELTALTPSGRIALATALCMAYLWITEVIPIPVTALLPLVMFPVFGVLSSKQVATNYGNHLIFLFVGGFMIAAAMERWQLHKRIALRITHAIGTNPSKLVLSLMVATAFLSMWISNTATVMMMFPIVAAIVHSGAAELSKEEHHRLGSLMMLSIGYAASIGGVSTLVGTPPNIVFSGLWPNLFPGAQPISFSKWFILALPLSTTLLVIVWLMLTRFFYKDVVRTANLGGTADLIAKHLSELGSMSPAEKRVATVFVSAALLWMFRVDLDLGFAVIPGWSSLLPTPKYIHDATVAIALGILLFIIPSGSEAHDRLLSWKYFKNTAPWGILILFGGGFALADALKQSGVTEWVASSLAPLAGFNPVIIVLVLCLALTFLTELTSNTATATAILPILAPLAVALSVHPLFLMAAATISCSCAFMLPVATPPNAIVFGSGWIKMSEMAKAGFLLNLIAAVVTSLYIYIFAGRVFGFDVTTLPVWAK